MSYTDFYLQAKGIADKIRSGEYQQQREVRKQTQGILERPNIKKIEAPQAESQFAETMYKIMSSFQEPVMPTRDNPVVTGETGIKIKLATEVSPKPSSRGLPPTRSVGKDYSIPRGDMEAMIVEEANLRGIDSNIALRIFYHEGAGAYQSQIARQGGGSLGGLEASFGPFQLFTGGGLGNEYEKLTGRILTEDNNPEGIRTQVQFALDKAAEGGWGPWYGRKPAKVGVRDGLQNAKPIGNWRK